MAYCLPAVANELVSPQEGVVNNVSSLSQITLTWNEWTPEEPPTAKVSVLNEAGEKVVVDGEEVVGNVDFDMADYACYTVTFVPAVTASGTYTVVIPTDILPGETTKEYRLTYKIDANLNGAVPTLVTPENGASIIQSDATPFNNIRLDFANAVSLTLNQDNISLTDENNTAVPFEVYGVYAATNPMLSQVPNPFVSIEFNIDGNLASGTYTLSLKPGAVTDQSGKINETSIDYTYTYTKTKADRDETPLVILSALMGKAIDEGSTYTWVGEGAVDVTPDMEVAQFVGVNTVGEGNEGTGFLLTFNHGEKAAAITYDLWNVTTNESIYNGNLRKQEDNTYLLPWIATTPLVKDNDYRLEFHAYDGENPDNRQEMGDGAELTFKGTSETYKFSSAEFVTVVPSPFSTLTSLDQNKVTVLFSQPAKVVDCQILLGGSMTATVKAEPSNEVKEYDNVWIVTIPEYMMRTYPDAIISVYAVGEDGLVVAGDQGWEDSACNQFEYKMTICLPKVMIGQSNTHVADLGTFSVYSADGRGIETSWVAYPYIIDSNGDKVAELNMEGYTDEWGDKVPFKVLRKTNDSEWDWMPLELEFQMTPVITKKGQYTLVIPDASFNIGSQFDSDICGPNSYVFWVTDFFPVTYSTDNSTIALAPVEITKSVDLAIETKENWKLETLTLNGEDVTADVADGRYVSPAASKAMDFVATFAYDGVVVTPTGVDDVVTDLNLRGWSDGGKLYVAGLKEGQIVNVYTVGGATVATATVGADDTLEFTLGQGIYIITVTEGAQTVALKLVNE